MPLRLIKKLSHNELKLWLQWTLPTANHAKQGKTKQQHSMGDLNASKCHVTLRVAEQHAQPASVIRICDGILSLCLMSQPLNTELLVYCIHAKPRLVSARS